MPHTLDTLNAECELQHHQPADLHPQSHEVHTAPSCFACSSLTVRGALLPGTCGHRADTGISNDVIESVIMTFRFFQKRLGRDTPLCCASSRTGMGIGI